MDKKTILARMGMLTLVLAGNSIGEDSPFRARVLNAEKNEGRQAVLSLLPEATTALETNMVYLSAFISTPKEERAAFYATIPMNALIEKTALYIQICLCPKDSNMNAQIRHYFDQRDLDVAQFWRNFKPSQATKEECIDFYETVLKNVQLNERTVDDLSRVRSELLKLRGY